MDEACQYTHIWVTLRQPSVRQPDCNWNNSVTYIQQLVQIMYIIISGTERARSESIEREREVESTREAWTLGLINRYFSKINSSHVICIGVETPSNLLKRECQRERERSESIEREREGEENREAKYTWTNKSVLQLN